MNSILSTIIHTTIKQLQTKHNYDGDMVSREVLAALFGIPEITLPIHKQVNLLKLTPTLEKKFKQIAEDGDVGAFLNYVNAMSPADYAALTPQDHMRAFLKPVEDEVEENCCATDFKGKEYYVGLISKRVYEETAEGIHEWRGILGIGEFVGMVMPEDD